MNRYAETTTIVVLDAPSKSVFGVDFKEFVTGDKFLGVKFLSSDIVHLIVYAPPGEARRKIGFFVRGSPGIVVVRRYDARIEELCIVDESSDDYQRIVAGVARGELDSGLGARDERDDDEWRSLSDRVSRATLKRCGLDFHSGVVGGDVRDHTCEKFAATPYFGATDRTPSFRDFSLRALTKGKSPRERTALVRDRTPCVEAMLSSAFEDDYDALFGELQLAFVSFLALECFVGLEAWKALTSSLCASGELARTKPEVMIAFIDVMRAQLEVVDPRDFEAADEDDDEINFLPEALADLISNCSEIEHLMHPIEDFFTFVESKFGPNFVVRE